MLEIRIPDALNVPSLATRGSAASAASVAAEALARIAGDAALQASKQSLSQRAQANGYASLDATGKVPTAQLPEVLLGAVAYQGTWNATTNSPAIPAAAGGNDGHFYIVAVAGTTAIDGISVWAVGDIIVSNGTVWQKVPHATNFELLSIAPTLLNFGGVPDYDDGANTGTDNASALQDMLDYVNALGGGTVRVTKNALGQGDYRFLSQVTIYDNTHLIIEAGCFLWRDYKSATSDYRGALIINEHCPPHANYIVDPGPYTQVDRNHDIRISGPGGFKVTTAIDASAISLSHFAGPFITLHWVDRPTIDGVAFGRVTRNSAVNIYGFDILYINNHHSDPTSSVFQTGLTIIGGQGGYVGGNIFNTGEDCIGLGSNYNLPLSDIEIGSNVYRSLFGHKLHIVQFRLGTTAAFATPTEYIQRINVPGGSGPVGQDSNAGIRINAHTGVTNKSVIRHVSIDGVMIDHGGLSHDDSNAYGIMIDGGFNIRIKAKILSPIRHAVRVTSGADRIFLDLDTESPSTSLVDAVHLDDVGEVEIQGRVQCGSGDGIYANDVDYLRLLPGLQIRDIPTNLAGVRLDGATKCVAHGVRFKEATAATGTIGIRSDHASVQLVHADCDFDEIDTPTSFAVAPVLNWPDSGVYTPVLAGVANVAASVAYQCTYQRNGRIVSVAGLLEVDPTAAAPTVTQLGISLPIASNLANSFELAGTATGSVQGENYLITGDVTNNKAELFFSAASAVNRTVAFNFQYLIV